MKLRAGIVAALAATACHPVVASSRLSGKFSALEVSGIDVVCGVTDEGGGLACFTGGELWVAPAPPATDVSGQSGMDCALFETGATCWISYEGLRATLPGWIAGDWVKIKADDDAVCLGDGDGAVTCVGDGAPAPPEDIEFSVFDLDLIVCGIVAGDGAILCYPDDDIDSAPSLPGTYQALAVAPPEVCALASGVLTCSGVDPFLTPPADQRFEQIDAWYNTVCGILDSGGIACWGDPAVGSDEGDQTTYYNVIGDEPTTGAYTAISVWYEEACAINTDGCIVCWGGRSDWFLSDEAAPYPTVEHPLCPSDFDRTAPIPNWIVGIP